MQHSVNFAFEFVCRRSSYPYIVKNFVNRLYLNSKNMHIILLSYVNKLSFYFIKISEFVHYLQASKRIRFYWMFGEILRYTKLASLSKTNINRQIWGYKTKFEKTSHAFGGRTESHLLRPYVHSHWSIGYLRKL